jgi:hypothetical protein
MDVKRWIVTGVAFAMLAPARGGIATGESLPAVSKDSSGCQSTAATPIPQPTQALLDAAGLGDIPLAPDSARVDLIAPPFSDPTAITNPLFPIAELDSAILNGRVDGKVFHTETTLLPFTQILEWTPGQCVRVLVSQYMAFLDGNLEETAIDLYAQADDGSVWYLGESVFDYDTAGRIVTTEGTWHAGTEGPAAMIMPGDPQVGDAHRPENIPGNVFEEVTISEIGQTFEGPSGPVSGGIIGTETHQDGSLSDKLFAPGYGEFRSTDGPDVEAMALASPTDALPGGVPSELATISSGADRIFGSDLATQGEWARADAIARRMVDAWNAFRTGDVPPRLVKPTRVALDRLVASLDVRDRTASRLASIDTAYASNDIQLRYRPATEVDTIRLGLWARRAFVHAKDDALGATRSALVTMEWIRDRVAHTLDAVTLTRVDSLLHELGVAVFDGDLRAAARNAHSLQRVVAAL